MEFLQTEYLPIGYLINKEGYVKSPYGKILKTQISNSGYYCLPIKVNGKQKGFFIHRAIAYGFIPNPQNKPILNHKDGNKLNNSLSNLEWCDSSHNMQHMYDTGLKKYRPLHYKGKFGSEHNRSKSVICVETSIEYGSQSEAQRLLGLGGGSVCWSIKNKKPIFGMHFEIKE